MVILPEGLLAVQSCDGLGVLFHRISIDLKDKCLNLSHSVKFDSLHDFAC